MNKEILEITKEFHDTYEKLASEYTYETREDTKVFDINSNNGKLMYATVNEIVSPILKENKILKENAENNDKVVDKVNWENQLLKKQLEEYKDKINWYENFEINKTIDKLRIKHNNQQKEFINYLEDEIKRLKENDIYQPLQKMALATHEHILQKYKNIIGVSDEKK